MNDGTEGQNRGPESGSSFSHDKGNSYRMFDRIHGRYDFLNRLFSFGQDVLWRRRVAKAIDDTPDQRLLDLAAGTGDVAYTVLKRRKEVKRAVACDMSRKMLETAIPKASKLNLLDSVSFVQADAGKLPFGDEGFHVVTMAFGIRNVLDVPTVLREIHRVLKENGQVAILEFSLPTNRLMRGFHLFYLRKVIPRIGALISKDKHAYRYLNETIETFTYGKAFCNVLESVGFKNVTFTPFTFGVATLYLGTK